ncbi:hypothetical protein L7F22_049890 [Adiantum nelumboides]|nr:hypothetical protein [Adiantum nelumboides]
MSFLIKQQTPNLFDYIERDCCACGILNSFNFPRLMENMRVIDNEICYRAKENRNVYDLFETRANLFKTVYTHAKVKALEYMLVDALVLANIYLLISENVQDPENFWKLDDTILKIMETSNKRELVEAQKLVIRMRHRELYQYCNEYAVPKEQLEHFKTVEPADIVCSQVRSGVDFSMDDIVVSNVKIDLTCGREDPVQRVHFFKDYESDEKFTIPKDRISHFSTLDGSFPSVEDYLNAPVQERRETATAPPPSTRIEDLNVGTARADKDVLIEDAPEQPQQKERPINEENVLEQVGVEQETQETLPKQILKEKKPVLEPPLKITPIRVVEPTTLIPRPTHMGESSTSAALFNEDIWMMQMQDQAIQMKEAYTRIRMSQSEVQEELRAMQIDRDTLLRKNQEQERLLEELQTTHIQVLLEMEDWKSRHEQTKAELSLKQQLQKDYDNLRRAHSIAITNMKAAQSQVQELLEFSPASLTTSAVPPQQLDNQLNEELQRLRQEVETLKKQLAQKMVVNLEQTKASKVPDSVQASSQPPAHTEPLPSIPPKLPPVEGQEEQHQTKHDEGPPPEQSDNSTLLERLIREEEVEQDPARKSSLKKDIKIIKQVKEQLPTIDKLYQAHRQETMPLLLLKYEHEVHQRQLMPPCTLEELGGYEPLTEEEINGKPPLKNQPMWRLKWLQQHQKAILEYAKAPCSCRVDPTFCPVNRCHFWHNFEYIQKSNPDFLNYPTFSEPTDIVDERYFLSYFSRELE